jgi:hypothetical protein
VTLTSLPRNIQRLLRVLSLFFNALSNQTFTTVAIMRTTSRDDNMMPSSKHGVKSKGRSWKRCMLSNGSSQAVKYTILWTRFAILRCPCSSPYNTDNDTNISEVSSKTPQRSRGCRLEPGLIFRAARKLRGICSEASRQSNQISRKSFIEPARTLR